MIPTNDIPRLLEPPIRAKIRSGEIKIEVRDKPPSKSLDFQEPRKSYWSDLEKRASLSANGHTLSATGKLLCEYRGSQKLSFPQCGCKNPPPSYHCFNNEETGTSRCIIQGTKEQESIALEYGYAVCKECPFRKSPQYPKDVTFGIITFDRPRAVENLVRSILRFYPLAKIVVVDNGKLEPNLSIFSQVNNGNGKPSESQISYQRIAYNSGISKSRNHLVSLIKTRYFLLMDDDGILTSPIVEELEEVLKHDKTIGVVGARIFRDNGSVLDWVGEISESKLKGQVQFNPCSREIRVTPNGTPYEITDTVLNQAALFRTKVAREVPWQDSLKVQEHIPYYYDLKKDGRWKAALCRHLYIKEDHSNDTREYKKVRFSKSRFIKKNEYLSSLGFSRGLSIHPWLHWSNNREKPMPHIFILGIGHSGTTILAKTLQALGWAIPNEDKEFAEPRDIRKINQNFINSESFDTFKAKKILEKLEKKSTHFCLKDPRFVLTLRQWLPLLADIERGKILVCIERDRKAVLESYRKRNEPLPDMDTLERSRDSQFERWPWPKLRISYEQLQAATALWTPSKE